MEYEEWKTNYENELEEYRKENVKIIYDYQDEYEDYLNSPEWVMYGDFNYFIRKGSEEISAQITAKYEEYIMEDLNLFEAFVNDKIETLHPLSDIDNMLNQIFKFSGFKNISIDTLSEEEKEIFENAKEKYKEDNAEIIQKLGGILDD